MTALSPAQEEQEPHGLAQKCFAEVSVLLTAHGETPDCLCHTSPTGDSVLFWGRPVIQAWPISFTFKREIKFN